MKTIFKTTDILKIGISRELNKKWEREGYLPGPSLKPAGGPWKAAEYSLGDLYMRAVFQKMTAGGSGFSLKEATSRLWDRGHPHMSPFNEICERIDSKYLAFPKVSKVELGKVFSLCIPFTKFSDLEVNLELDQQDYDDVYILNWLKIKSFVDRAVTS